MKFNLSEIRELIRSRRTVKPEEFSGRDVPREIIAVLLDSARWAPTHGMTQPWRFKVFTREGIQRLASFHAEKYREVTPPAAFKEAKYRQMQSRPLLASAVIALCMHRQEEEKIPEIEEVEAVACAVQNMFLTATAYGLACYWGSGGLTYHEAMKEFLGLGGKDKCLGFMYLGYPRPEIRPAGQRRPVESFTEWISS